MPGLLSGSPHDSHAGRDVWAFLALSCDVGVHNDVLGTQRAPTISPKPPASSTQVRQVSWTTAGVRSGAWAPSMALIRSYIEQRWAEHGFPDRFLVGWRLMGVLMGKRSIPACWNSNKAVYGPSLIYSWWLKSLFPQTFVSQHTQAFISGPLYAHFYLTA